MKNIVLRRRDASVTCVNCGCTDESPCRNGHGVPCRWLRHSKTLGFGLCSNCRKLLPKWPGLVKRRFNQVDAEARKLYRPGRAMRVCLKCDRDFLSDGKFNRICPDCQQANALVVEFNGRTGDWVPLILKRGG